MEDRTVPSTFTVTASRPGAGGLIGDLRFASLMKLQCRRRHDNFDSSVFSHTETIILAGTELEFTDTTGATSTRASGGVTVSGGGASRVFRSMH